MGLEIIEVGTLPSELRVQLMDDEKVHYFSYISLKGGGCGNSSNREEHWISLTDKRVIYKTKINIQGIMTEKDGILPMDKISFVEVTEQQTGSCCSSTKFYLLEIGTSGGTVGVPLPTKEKCYEIRRIYSEINEHPKKKRRVKK